MIQYVLIWALTATSPPVYMGKYKSLEACNNAIRVTMLMKFSDEFAKTEKAKQIVDTQMKYQREFKCNPTEVTK